MCWLVRSSTRADHSIGSALLQLQTGFGGKDHIGNWRSNCRRPGRTTEFARHARAWVRLERFLRLGGRLSSPEEGRLFQRLPLGRVYYNFENGRLNHPSDNLKDFPRGFTSRLGTKEFAVNRAQVHPKNSLAAEKRATVSRQANLLFLQLP
jgi:hypothetical protein